MTNWWVEWEKQLSVAPSRRKILWEVTNWGVSDFTKFEQHSRNSTLYLIRCNFLGTHACRGPVIECARQSHKIRLRLYTNWILALEATSNVANARGGAFLDEPHKTRSFGEGFTSDGGAKGAGLRGSQGGVETRCLPSLPRDLNPAANRSAECQQEIGPWRHSNCCQGRRDSPGSDEGKKVLKRAPPSRVLLQAMDVPAAHKLKTSTISRILMSRFSFALDGKRPIQVQALGPAPHLLKMLPSKWSSRE